MWTLQDVETEAELQGAEKDVKKTELRVQRFVDVMKEDVKLVGVERRRCRGRRGQRQADGDWLCRSRQQEESQAESVKDINFKAAAFHSSCTKKTCLYLQVKLHIGCFSSSRLLDLPAPALEEM